MSELGIWPIEKLIELKRVMLLHNIMISKGERIIKNIVIEQIRRPWKGCWIEKTREITTKYNIDIKRITEMSKDKLKNIVKCAINKSLETQMKDMAKEKTKLRFLDNFKQESYIDNLQYNDTISMIKIRLNMIETKCNYKGQFKQNLLCDMCKKENDTTEHILQCKTTQHTRLNEKDIQNCNPKIIIEINKAINSRIERGYNINIGEKDEESSDEE